MKRKASFFDQIKQQYIGTQLSITQLAARHNVPASTLEKRCAREGWRKQIVNIEKVAEESANTAFLEAAKSEAAARGTDLAKLAMQFIHDTITDGGKFREKIMEALEKTGIDDPYGIRVLMAGYRDHATVLRMAFGIDREGGPPRAPVVIVGRMSVMMESKSALDAPAPERVLPLECVTSHGGVPVGRKLYSEGLPGGSDGTLATSGEIGSSPLSPD